MRPIKLYDTGTRDLRAFEPRDPKAVGIYACGPTVYSRVHVGNARPFVVFSQLKRFLEHEGYGVTFVANITDINDKIYDAARAAGRESADLAREMTAHYIADTERIGLGRPDHEPLASEYIEPILRPDRRAGRARARVRGRRRRLLPRAHAARVRVAVAPRRRPDGPGRGRVEGADLKEDPLDFALWKAHKEGEDTVVGLALGPRPAGLAHRVLGDGRGAAGAGVRHPRRRHRPRVPASRERDRADRRRAREAAGAAVDAQRDARGLRGREDGQVGRQHPRAGRRARRGRRSRRWSCTSRAATTGSRCRSRPSRSRRRATRRGGSARPGAG